MPDLTGLAETALFVADLEAARRFYRESLGLEELRASDEGCVFRIGPGVALLLVSREKAALPSRTPGGDVPPTHVGAGDPIGAGHLAFRVSENELAAWRDRLRSSGVDVLSEVAWEGGERSLYFRDPDGHLLELVTGDLWRGSRGPPPSPPRRPREDA